jgi:hypothetical protein
MTLILHIGGPKAGSTSVQAALRSNRSLLRRNRITITRKKRRQSRQDPESLGFHSLFYAVHRGGRPRGDRNRFSTQEAYEGFRNNQAAALHHFLAARARKGKHVIVSDEYLYQLDGETIDRLARFLDAAGHADVRVILYVREPASLFLSLAQQRLKADCRLADPFSWHYPYLDYLDAWERVFPGRLEVRAFDRSALAGGSVVADFAAYVGAVLGLPAGALAGLDGGADANQSLSAEAMALLWAYQHTFHSRDAGRFTEDGRRLTAALLLVGQRLGLEPPRLRQPIRALIVQRHRPELQALAERYGIRFASLDAPDQGATAADTPEAAAPSGALSVHDLIENLDPQAAEQLRLHCLAELSAMAAR